MRKKLGIHLHNEKHFIRQVTNEKKIKLTIVERVKRLLPITEDVK